MFGAVTMNRSPGAINRVSVHNAEYGVRLNQALRHARSVSDEELVKIPLDAISEALVNEHAAAPVVIHFDQMWWERQDSPIRTGVPVDGFGLAVKFPATGCTGALLPYSAALSLSINSTGDEPATISVYFNLKDQQPSDLAPEAFRDAAASARMNLERMEQSANIEIAVQRRRMLEEVQAIIQQRGRRLLAFRRAADELGIPLASSSEAASIKLQPRRLTLRQLDRAIEAGSPEWHLEETIAEDVIATIMSFTSALERLTVTADKLAGENEETIRDLLLFILNSNYQGAATGETFLGYGKTDVLLRWRDRDAFIGECKYWHGGAKFTLAIEQLLGRYTIWRDTRVALILFIRNASNISEIINKAKDCIINSDRLIQAITPVEPDRRRDYLVRAANDDHRVIRLALIPVVIPRATIRVASDVASENN
jgi:hypothetical protein